MNSFQSKKKIKKVLQHKVVVAISLVFAVLLYISTYDLYQKKKQVSKLRDAAKLEFESTVEKNAAVDQDLKNVDSPHGREKLIRQKYNVKKPGEQVIVVTENTNKNKEVQVIKKSLFEKATDYLGGYF